MVCCGVRKSLKLSSFQNSKLVVRLLLLLSKSVIRMDMLRGWWFVGTYHCHEIIENAIWDQHLLFQYLVLY
jgi:hypothetical protein